MLAGLAARMRWIALCFAVLYPWASRTESASAQTSPHPSLFLSCPLECFDSYLRQELSYFDFARDPHIADYTLVIARQIAGNGGERFTVTMSARRPGPRALPAPQSFAAPSGTSAYDVRQLLLQVLLRMLHAELAGSEHERAFSLALPRRDGATLSALRDPWNYWVISPEVEATGEAGSAYYQAEITGALTLRRITELSKIRLGATYGRKLSGYRLEDGSRVRGDVYAAEARAVYAASVGRHSALGAVVHGKSDQFENLRGHVHGGPLAEFNVFPYAENATRQLRLAYQVGPWANWYFERNVANLKHELRAYHALSLIADVNLPWGSVQWIGQVNSFVTRPKLYRLSVGAVLSVRLYEGLAFSLEGEAAYVHDLINLRKRPIEDVELLLWTAQPPTDYMAKIELALSYTFGSVHNTIVNPRFARVDLDEE